MIDVVTNPAQTTPTHSALNFPGENPAYGQADLEALDVL